ncbi:regulator [Thioclava sp. SK-1]|uniref:response regulator n=1 Tax=Thioclava sp. SK-1 TaxID=1889770 RepID=UPI000825BFDC|nr:response regulator [Thioclava sp. SK-1]OCX61439.1 regulator [Thioclava sp. SK-1]
MARILIADDDHAYLDVFCDGMAAMGHEAVGVSRGDAALDRLRKEDFDIVFLDVIMPGGGAITLGHSVRNMNAELPIVVITGRPELGHSPLLRNGLRFAQAKLQKTASLSELDRTVRQLAPAANLNSNE